jgi:hypothetical protein
MEITEAREILEDIALADAITPDLQVATEVVLARVDELENVVSAYRKGQPAPARDTDAPEDYSETCECSLCREYRNRRWNGADAMQPIAPESIDLNWSQAVSADDVRNVI